MGEPLVSVIIPTRNRAKYCLRAIDGVLALPGPLELVVQDSSESSELAEAVAGARFDPRLRYVRVSPALNMTENFEEAVARAKGEFVTVIGDDDCVTSLLMEAVRACRAGRVDALTAGQNYAQYNWPDFRSRYGGASRSGVLAYWAINPREEAVLDIARERQCFLESGLQGPGRLPRLYHGLIRRSVLDELRTRFGRCFFGASPDVSFSYAASLVVATLAEVNYPIVINGSSGGSNAGRSAMRTHSGPLRGEPHLERYKALSWPKVIPQFFSVETLWAQAAIAAIEEVRPEDLASVNFGRLYALCLIRHPRYVREVRAAFSECQARLGSFPVRRFKAEFSEILRAQGTHLGSALKRKLGALTGHVSVDGPARVHVDAGDVAVASARLEELLAEWPSREFA